MTENRTKGPYRYKVKYLGYINNQISPITSIEITTDFTLEEMAEEQQMTVSEMTKRIIWQQSKGTVNAIRIYQTTRIE